jgi:hypothetical protein
VGPEAKCDRGQHTGAELRKFGFHSLPYAPCMATSASPVIPGERRRTGSIDAIPHDLRSRTP